MSTTTQLAKASDRPLRILIADDHPIGRKTVRNIIEQHPRLNVCGEAQDGSQAIAKTEELHPDVVVLNVEMPVMNGIAAAREIKTKCRMWLS